MFPFDSKVQERSRRTEWPQGERCKRDAERLAKNLCRPQREMGRCLSEAGHVRAREVDGFRDLGEGQCGRGRGGQSLGWRLPGSWLRQLGGQRPPAKARQTRQPPSGVSPALVIPSGCSCCCCHSLLLTWYCGVLVNQAEGKAHGF